MSVILLSSTFDIVAVLRTFRPRVPEGRDPTCFQFYEVGAKYAPLKHHFSNPRTFEPMTRVRLEGMLRDTSAAQQEEPDEEEVNALLPQDNTEMRKKTKNPKKKKKEAKYTLRKALVNGASDYGAQLVEEVIRSSSIDGNKFVSQIASQGTSPPLSAVVDEEMPGILSALMEAFSRADEIVTKCGSEVGKGYITTLPPKDESSKDPIYEDYMPFHPTNLAAPLSSIEFESVPPFP